MTISLWRGPSSPTIAARPLRRALWAVAAAAIGFATPAAAQAVDTSHCATISPVTRSIDIAGLQRDADCFGAAADADGKQADGLRKAASSARASQKYRLERIAAVKAMPPPGYQPAASLDGVIAIPTTDFDPATMVKPFNLPPPQNPLDVVGAFRFNCGPGQLLADDPIVLPGQPGKSHLHQFYGNLDANAYSTYASLRAHGDSTCDWSGKRDGSGGLDRALNRSGYWMPALLDGKGNVKRPKNVAIYYKREPASSAQCTNALISHGCVAIPNGLKMISGRNMLDLSKPPTGNFHYNCVTTDGHPIYKDGRAVPGYGTLAEVASFCPAGNDIGFSIDFPTCWDGKNVDSPDHMSHVGFRYNAGQKYLSCPAATPYLMPAFKLTAFYHINPGVDPTLWRLSSDMMAPGEPAGSTLHADYFEAWDPRTKAVWTKNCLDDFLNSTMGNLCNGTGLVGAAWGDYPVAPDSIPLTAVPKTPVR